MTKPIWIVSLVLLFLVILWGRVVISSYQAYHAGVDALSNAHHLDQTDAQLRQIAVDHLAQAIRWYAPGNPFVARSLDQLWQLSQDCLRQQDEVLAMLAWEEMRAAIFAIRSLYQPYAHWIGRLNIAIAEQRGRQYAASQPSMSDQEGIELYLERLQAPVRPHVGWALAVSLSFLSWVTCVLAWIWRGFDAQGRMSISASWPWFIGFVSSFVVWLVSLLKA